ncbi:hypothetical protein N8I77_005224 [Diaporthe amygdali]|uniref:Azaphilone pigments biosynthesis cluster protein L N-terminal domain-containing protein n=1 Tax=Phomopsis amygdali TaxID=1214568 RepID=A0AAD9SQ08_PHOAM|nr:hypothetical protein N8I77_005224 [Diaporthe amygdali]
MAIEPLSITAAVIGVVRLTYDSCKSLNEKLKGIKHAPQKLETLHRDLDTFQAVLNSHDEASFSVLEDAALSSDQQASLEALLTAMEGCQTVCADFEKMLSHLTSHSNDHRIALRDRIRLHFNDSEIELLKENLVQSQRTLNDALGFANLSTTRKSQQVVDELASKYAQSMNDIGGRIHGLELVMHALSMAPAGITNEDVAKVVSVLKKHEQMLKKCLKVYQPAFKETSTLACTTVKYQNTYDNARLMTGNIDYAGEAIPVSVGHAEARGQSRMLMGNMSSQAAEKFWK